MKKALIIFILVLITALCGCSSGTTVKSQKCKEHDFTERTETVATTFKEGTKTILCKKCGYKETVTVPATNSLKVLCLGNSYSIDSMEYLYDIAKDGGVEQVILGNLTISACNLDMHWENMSSGSSLYAYRLNQNGKWAVTEKAVAQNVLKDGEWDVVVIQIADVFNSYNQLPDIVEYVEENVANPDLRIYWNLNWAYQQDSTHGNFKHFNNSQSEMYDKILGYATRNINPYAKIDGIIPSGTAIQNLRTTSIGDTLTRDGYHLSYDYGRYCAALTWFSFLTEKNADCINWVPPEQSHIKKELDLIKKSVNDAIATPLAVTEQ